MSSTEYISELLKTGDATEGSLLIAKTLYGRMIDAVTKKRIGRQFAALYFGPGDIPNASVDINLETADSMQVYKVAEGAAVPIDVTSYSSFNLKPAKYGVRPLITREMVEDSAFPLMQRNIAMAGREIGENEDALIISDALNNASNTITGGAAITIANITRAMQYLEDSDFTPDTMICGPEVVNDLRNISELLKVNEAGSDEMRRTGYIGTFMGMRVHVVSGNILTSTTAFIFDSSQAFVIAEKRPVTMEDYDDKVHDMSGVVITQRFVTRHLKAGAICKITTT